MAFTTINDPSAQFQTTLYTGDDATDRALTNTGNSNLQPDWVWIKCRNDTYDHVVVDSSRGASTTTTGTQISSNLTTGQPSNTNGHVKSFNTDGFNVRSGSSGGNPLVGVNKSAKTYVAWQWKANGGTTASNGNGSITSTVQANTTAGFSIVKWTGTGSAATIGHGLGVTPQFIIVKNLDKSSQWAVYHHKVGATKYVALNDDDAVATYSGYWNDTSPTTSVFSVGSDGDVSGGNGEEVISYCFAPIKGYSKFGAYTGNGNANGPFVYTGFKPAWVMIKELTATGSWHMFDTKRNVDNVSNNVLYADLGNAESTNNTGNPIDILSNGFKCRGTGNDTNNDGNDYIYMTFAQIPLVATNNVVATAR